MLRYAAAAVTSLALLLTVGGCGDDAPPPPQSEPSRTATTPAATHSPTPPTLPAAAKATDDAAVEAFARHYIELINYASNTGDVSELRAASDHRCKSCNYISTRIHRIYAAGGSIESKGWKVLGTSVVPKQPLSRKYIDLKIRQTPQVVHESRGAKAQRFKGGTQFFTMLMARSGHSWAVTRMDLSQ